MKPLIQRLRRAILLQDGAGMTDAELVECFIERDDEAAFEALMRFHGPMVFGVCQRILANHHDAEEAFQATFLVFARKARSISARQTVANWLFSVAHRTALNARRTRAKRVVKEMNLATVAEAAVKEQDPWSDLAPLLDQELNRLPEKYRTAVLLCDLEGKSQKEAARQVGCPEGTLSSRLTRARNLLANRLTRRGLVFPVGSIVVLLSQNAASASVPTSLTDPIIEAARVSAVSQAAAQGVISPQVAALTEGTVKLMFLSMLRSAAALLAFVAVLGLGAGVLLYQMQAAENPDQVSASDSTGSKASAGPKPHPDEIAIQGTWTVVKMEFADPNSSLPERDLAAIKAGEWKAIYSARCTEFRVQGKLVNDAPYKLDTTAQPKRIQSTTFSPDKTKSVDTTLIYQLDGDTLLLCNGQIGEPVPTGFDLAKAKSGTVLGTLKRDTDTIKKQAKSETDQNQTAVEPAPALASEEGYGSVVGRFVWDGEFPKVPPLVQANAAVRDAALCATNDIPSERLLVDPQTGGICNIFVYLKKATQIHPDLKDSPTKEIAFDQKNCRFVPHALFVRTDQTVRALSDDPNQHNVHTYPIRNSPINLGLAKERQGVPLTVTRPESCPFEAKCDMHPWMSAHWLVLDHPYAALTGQDGVFSIDKLPAGEHLFTVWHEQGGYIERTLRVTINSGKTTALAPTHLGAERFGFVPDEEEHEEFKGFGSRILKGAKVTSDDKLPGVPVISIDFSGSAQISDKNVYFLKLYKHLKRLNLSATKSTGTGLKELKGLTELVLTGTPITDLGMTELGALRNLTELDLSGCTQITDAGIQEIGGLTNLTKLNLAGTRITDACVNDIGKLKKLKQLSLEKTRITDAGLRELEVSLPRLQITR